MTRDAGPGTRDARDIDGDRGANEPSPNGGIDARGAPPEMQDGDAVSAEQHQDDAAGSALSPPASRLPPPALSRRHALKVLGVAPVGALAWMQQQQQQGQQKTPQTHEAPNPPAADTKQPPPSPRKQQFFTARELRTMRVLADDIIPRDERSGSATDAGVIQFIDFNLSVPETEQDTRIAWRGGLRWLDTESRKRFGVAYAAAKTAQRHALLDDISFPSGVPAGAPPGGGIPPALRYGAAFFARARDMVAAGFFSSATGFKDLQYIGNTANPNWQGCPEPALRKLGVSYDLMNTSVKPEER